MRDRQNCSSDVKDDFIRGFVLNVDREECLRVRQIVEFDNLFKLQRGYLFKSCCFL